MGGAYGGGTDLISSRSFSNVQNMRKQRQLLLMAQSWGHHHYRKGHDTNKKKQMAMNIGAQKEEGQVVQNKVGSEVFMSLQVDCELPV